MNNPNVLKSCIRHFEAQKANCSGFVNAVARDFNIELGGQANHIFDFTTASILDRIIDTATADIPVDSLMKLANESTIDLINNDPALIASFRNNLNSYKAFNEDYLYSIQGTVDINNTIISKIKEEYGREP